MRINRGTVDCCPFIVVLAAGVLRRLSGTTHQNHQLRCTGGLMDVTTRKFTEVAASHQRVRRETAPERATGMDVLNHGTIFAPPCPW